MKNKDGNVINFSKYLSKLKGIEHCTVDLNLAQMSCLDSSIYNDYPYARDTMIEFYMTDVLACLSDEGVDIYDDRFRSDFAIAVEFLRSAVMRNLGEDHPFHSLISDNFDFDFNGEESIGINLIDCYENLEFMEE